MTIYHSLHYIVIKGLFLYSSKMQVHGGKWMYLTHLTPTLNMLSTVLSISVYYANEVMTTHCSSLTFQGFLYSKVKDSISLFSKRQECYCPYNNISFWNTLFFITAHYKRFNFPKLKVFLTYCDLLHMQMPSNYLHITAWDWSLVNQCKSVDTLESTTTENNKLFFVSVSGVSCLLPESVKLSG